MIKMGSSLCLWLNFFFKKRNLEVYFVKINQTCQRCSIIDPCKLEPMFRLAALSQNRAKCPSFLEKSESVE